jgi:hypothetical protein
MMSVLDLEVVHASDTKISDTKTGDTNASDTRSGDTIAPGRPRPIRAPARTARGRARAGTPHLRPAAPLPAPTLAPTASPARHPRACVASVPETSRSTPNVQPRHVDPRAGSWRITDRGIAVVLVAVAMVAVAALAVVVPTALRVTGDNYQPIGTSQLARP